MALLQRFELKQSRLAPFRGAWEGGRGGDGGGSEDGGRNEGVDRSGIDSDGGPESEGGSRWSGTRSERDARANGNTSAGDVNGGVRGSNTGFEAGERGWGYDLNGKVLGNIQNAADDLGVKPSSLYDTTAAKYFGPAAVGLTKAVGWAQDNLGLPGYAMSADERAANNANRAGGNTGEGGSLQRESPQWGLKPLGSTDSAKAADTITDPNSPQAWWKANSGASDVAIRRYQDANKISNADMAKTIGRDPAAWDAQYLAATPYFSYGKMIDEALSGDGLAGIDGNKYGDDIVGGVMSLGRYRGQRSAA